MTKIAVLHGRWSRNADYGGAYEALGEEFDLARSVIDTNATVRLPQPQRAKRQKTPRRAGRESARKRASSD
ncbi:MAG TPA: hypothetical protein VFO14_08070 [Vicinamibacterales bacterium]|nr:hypothetical protein [Vicinamibacterales bacterium]